MQFLVLEAGTQALEKVRKLPRENTAVVLGKATVGGVGNYTFQATLIDNGQPGTNSLFGLQVKDPSGAVVPDLSFSPINLGGGTIQAPHK